MEYNIYMFLQRNKEGNIMSKNKLIHLSILATLTAGTIYGINKTINLISNAKSTLNNPQGKLFRWRFGNVFYTVQGSGKPVLLIHDLHCGASDTEWNFIVNTYAKTHTVYTLDLLGCGRSDKPSITYTNYLYVQLITDFIKNIITHRTDVVVTGFSSSFVIMACNNDDSLFDKIMLINPNSIAFNSQLITRNNKMMKFLLEAPLIGTLIYNINNMKKNYIELFENEFYHNPYAVRRSLIQKYYDSAHYGPMTSKYLFASISANYIGISINQALKHINNSIIIIGAEFESNINQTICEYTTLNSAIEVAMIKESKHLPQLEKPTELLSIMNDFLN